MQFTLGTVSLLLWLITFTLMVAYSQRVNTLSIQWTTRRASWPVPGWGVASSVMSGAVAQGTTGTVAAWRNATLTSLQAAGCGSAPLCDCLKSAFQAASDLCPTKGQAMAQNCFLWARPPQTMDSLAMQTRPYIWLLSMNLWSALVACVLLVKEKLEDKGSYAVQLILQVIVLALTMGAFWFMWDTPPSEWVVVLVVSIAIMWIGWVNDSQYLWEEQQFLLLYPALLTVMAVMANAYYQRTDAMYMSATVLLTMCVAVLLCAEWIVENTGTIACTCKMQFWAGLAIIVSAVGLISFSFADCGLGGTTLQSAPALYFVYCLFILIALARPIQEIMGWEVLIRLGLTVAMIDEMWQ